jgi:hypothetical protein
MSTKLEATYPNLVMFSGTTPNIGTTLAAFGTGIALAAGASGLSVVYLCLNLKSSKIGRYIGRTSPDTGLGALRLDLKARTLTPERLEKHCLKLKGIPNLHVLTGNMQRAQAELYEPEDIEHLLQTAASAYDICIADCHAYWDNAATIVTALKASMRFLVTMPRLDAFQDDFHAWITETACLFDLAPQQFELVLAQAGRYPDEYRAGEIEQVTRLAVAGTLPYDKQLAHEMQRGRLHERLLQDAAENPMGILAKHIADRLHVAWKPPGVKRIMARFKLRAIKRAMEVRT